MAVQINIDDILKPSPNYPIQNILIDTSTIINYEDPFGWIDPKLNETTVRYLEKLKSQYKVNSTLLTASEYFKHIQVGSYNIFTKTQPGYFESYSTIEFKKLRRRNTDFANTWNLRLKKFKITLKKHFPPFDIENDKIYSLNLLDNFNGAEVDFGDEVLYRYSLKTDFPLIITSDRDFESFPDNLHVVFI